MYIMYDKVLEDGSDPLDMDMDMDRTPQLPGCCNSMDGVLRRACGGPLSLATGLSLSGTCRHSTLFASITLSNHQSGCKLACCLLMSTLLSIPLV